MNIVPVMTLREIEGRETAPLYPVTLSGSLRT